jgi:type IV pilus assembly protein PilM
MALFGTANSFVGLDIGTSSLKVVELLQRKGRLEVVTYAEANFPNILLNPTGQGVDAVRETANVITRTLEEAEVSSERVVAALPSSVVFSTTLVLPPLPDNEMSSAVHFAARDVVPADLDEMVLGWKRVGELPHMDNEAAGETKAAAPQPASQETVPVFLTAAPRDVVNRYVSLLELLHLELVALEVETFPLIRSLLSDEAGSALIVDIGDTVTTYHLIDQGTPAVSHTIEWGGQNLTTAIAETAKISVAEAAAAKVRYGLLDTAPPDIQAATRAAVDKLFVEAERLATIHTTKTKRLIKKTILIGGGAKLRDLSKVWTARVRHSAIVGNPWKGLTYPDTLEKRAAELGPTFAVAVGLAQRGFAAV